MKKYLMLTLILALTSTCTISHADIDCLQTLTGQFKDCVNDDEISKKVHNIAQASLWLEDKSRKYIHYCKKHNIDTSFHLLKAIGKSRIYTKGHYKKMYDALDNDKVNFNFIALLAFLDVSIISAEELEEYVRCTWKSRKKFERYSSSSIFYYIIEECLKKKLEYSTRKLPRDKAALTDEICTPNWLIIENQIGELLTELKSPGIHFEDTTSLPIENNENIDDMVEFYNKWIPEEVEFKNNRLKEIKNLVRTDFFLEQKLAEFNPVANKDKITDIAKKETSLFPGYVMHNLSVGGQQPILWVLEKESNLTNNELLLLLKNTLNLKYLGTFMFFHYGKERYDYGIRKERYKKQQEHLPAIHEFGSSHLWPGKKFAGTWDRDVNFKEIDGCVIHTNSNIPLIIDLYKDLFLTIHADIPMPDDKQINAMADTLLVIEEDAIKLMGKSEDEIKILIKKTYDAIKKELPPKCICHNHPFCKMRVLSILLALLDESQQETSLKNNLVTILHIENLFNLKFPEKATRHFELKSQYLPNTSQIINIIDTFDSTPKRNYELNDEL